MRAKIARTFDNRAESDFQVWAVSYPANSRSRCQHDNHRTHRHSMRVMNQ